MKQFKQLFTLAIIICSFNVFAYHHRTGDLILDGREYEEDIQKAIQPGPVVRYEINIHNGHNLIIPSGTNLSIINNVNIYLTGGNIIIGDNVTINGAKITTNVGKIQVGNNVRIGAGGFVKTKNGGLSITGGNDVHFEAGAHFIHTGGALTITGSVGNRATLTGDAWKGIKSFDAETATISYADISGMGGNDASFLVQGAATTNVNYCNFFQNNTSASYGGGITISSVGASSSAVRVENNIFQANTGKSGAGMGIYTAAGTSDVIIRNNLFQDNFATLGGGGLSLHSYSQSGAVLTADYTVENNVFRDNKGQSYAGALYYTISGTLNGVGLIQNNIMHNNESNTGGAMYMNGVHRRIFSHNTVAYNKSNGGAIYVHGNCKNSASFMNNITWDNYSTKDGEMRNYYTYDNYETSFENNLLNNGAESILIYGGTQSRINPDHFFLSYPDGSSRMNIECDPRFINVPNTTPGEQFTDNSTPRTNFNEVSFANLPYEPHTQQRADFGLQAISPAIYAAKSGQSIGAVAFHGTKETAAPCTGDAGPTCTLAAEGTKVDETCLTRGKITIDPIGSQGNVSYLWSDDNTDQERELLVEGTYTVTVTDDVVENCTTELSFEIADNNPLKLELDVVDAVCGEGGEIGMIASGDLSDNMYYSIGALKTGGGYINGYSDYIPATVGDYHFVEIVAINNNTGCKRNIKFENVPVTVGNEEKFHEVEITGNTLDECQKAKINVTVHNKESHQNPKYYTIIEGIGIDFHYEGRMNQVAVFESGSYRVTSTVSDWRDKSVCEKTHTEVVYVAPFTDHEIKSTSIKNANCATQGGITFSIYNRKQYNLRVTLVVTNQDGSTSTYSQLNRAENFDAIFELEEGYYKGYEVKLMRTGSNCEITQNGSGFEIIKDQRFVYGKIEALPQHCLETPGGFIISEKGGRTLNYDWTVTNTATGEETKTADSKALAMSGNYDVDVYLTDVEDPTKCPLTLSGNYDIEKIDDHTISMRIEDGTCEKPVVHLDIDGTVSNDMYYYIGARMKDVPGDITSNTRSLELEPGEYTYLEVKTIDNDNFVCTQQIIENGTHVLTQKEEIEASIRTTDKFCRVEGQLEAILQNVDKGTTTYEWNLESLNGMDFITGTEKEILVDESGSYITKLTIKNDEYCSIEINGFETISDYSTYDMIPKFTDAYCNLDGKVEMNFNGTDIGSSPTLRITAQAVGGQVQSVNGSSLDLASGIYSSINLLSIDENGCEYEYNLRDQEIKNTNNLEVSINKVNASCSKKGYVEADITGAFDIDNVTYAWQRRKTGKSKISSSNNKRVNLPLDGVSYDVKLTLTDNISGCVIETEWQAFTSEREDNMGAEMFVSKEAHCNGRDGRMRIRGLNIKSGGQIRGRIRLYNDAWELQESYPGLVQVDKPAGVYNFEIDVIDKNSKCQVMKQKGTIEIPEKNPYDVEVEQTIMAKCSTEARMSAFPLINGVRSNQSNKYTTNWNLSGVENISSNGWHVNAEIGNYQGVVELKHTNGCEVSKNVSFEVEEEPCNVIVNKVNVNPCNAVTSWLELNVSGGTGNYEYRIKGYKLKNNNWRRIRGVNQNGLFTEGSGDISTMLYQRISRNKSNDIYMRFSLDIYEVKDDGGFVLVYNDMHEITQAEKDGCQFRIGNEPEEEVVPEAIDMEIVSELDVETEEELIEMSYYPNPAQDQLTIESSFELENARVQIFNSIGALVYSGPINNMVNRINVSEYQNGMYIIRIKLNNVIIDEKPFVVAK